MNGVWADTLVHEVVQFAATGLLGLALGVLLARRLNVAIGMLAGQGLLLALAAGAVALDSGTLHSWIGFGVTLLVKALLIPLVLFHVVRRLKMEQALRLGLSLKLAVPVAIGLMLTSWQVTAPFTDITHLIGGRDTLSAGLALLLVGLFTMVARTTAFSQVMALVTMENGLYLATIAATGGLPLTVEVGVALDIVTGVALMALVIHELSDRLNTIDTEHLRQLRG